MGPVLCHSFCNYMGFPAISAALEHPHRIAILSSYLLGVFLFFFLLFPFTDPSYYGLVTPVCTLAPSTSSLCISWSPLSHTPLVLSRHLRLMKQMKMFSFFFAKLEFRSGPVWTHSADSCHREVGKSVSIFSGLWTFDMSVHLHDIFQFISWCSFTEWLILSRRVFMLLGVNTSGCKTASVIFGLGCHPNEWC